MKLKYFLLGLFVLLFVGCTSDSSKFKNEYEKLNGVVNSNGKEYRSVSIGKNPFVYSSASDIVNKIENKDTFYVYFGSSLCPWCRSVIEKAISSANNNGIDKIYYVDIWDSNGSEILRDKYIFDSNSNLVKVDNGTDDYFKLLEYFSKLLPDYTYAANKNGGKKLDISEKRIYIPAFIYIYKGQALRLESGISDSQVGSRDDLTDKILSDEEEKFNLFFNSNYCEREESC